MEGFFCEIFCFMYQVLQKYPSVTCGASSPKGEPMHKSESLNKNQPPLKGEGNRRQTVEGFFVESFA